MSKLGGDPRRVRRVILEVVENQLRDNDPPETHQTYQRLMSQGYTASEAKRLVANLVAREIYSILKEQRAYDQDGYIAALARLPELPD